MTQDTFTKALALAKEHESNITLGGGEPTLHPLFKDFLLQAIWELASISNENDSPAVTMVTNGSQTDIALNLAQLAKRGVIHVSLSRDQYHAPIDERVVKAFTKPKRDHYATLSAREEFDCRDLRGNIYSVLPQGRAKSWGNREMNGLCCGGIFCTPKGTLYPCECHRDSLGTVNDPHSVVSDHFTSGYCYKSQDYQDEIVPMITEHKTWRVAHVSVNMAKETVSC